MVNFSAAATLRQGRTALVAARYTFQILQFEPSQRLKVNVQKLGPRSLATRCIDNVVLPES